ncbi:MAG: hypothetical protein KJ747_08465 [Actinobacteria bacterium]|nr:hypothetical protein [Actinomycetota bacterium]MCG2808046.1 hypothetical protein [Coriobacteriia bacterium]
MASRIDLSVARTEQGLGVTMPPGGNRWIIGLGLFGGIPWLVAFVAGSIGIAILAPPELRRTAILGVVAVNLLFFIVHVLAVAGIWLAIYNMRGTETLLIEAERFTVARTGMGITVPMRLRRSPDAHFALLDTSIPPGKGPHPRLEVRSAGSAMRFGAGTTDAQARQILDACGDELGSPTQLG